MRHGLFTLLAIGSALLIHAPARAQSPVFGGSLTATLTPSDPSADGSSVNFTAAGGFSTSTQPFLLGTVDFLAGGAAKSFVFTAGLEVQSNGASQVATFSTNVPVVDAPTGPPGAQGLVFRGQPADNFSIDGHQYFFDLAGVTASNVYDNPQDSLVSAGGDRQQSGFVWGSVSEVQTMTHQHHCHETPEPSTWLLASLAALGTAGWQWRKRYSAAAV